LLPILHHLTPSPSPCPHCSYLKARWSQVRKRPLLKNRSGQVPQPAQRYVIGKQQRDGNNNAHNSSKVVEDLRALLPARFQMDVRVWNVASGTQPPFSPSCIFKAMPIVNLNKKIVGTPCANACVILRRGDETSVFVSRSSNRVNLQNCNNSDTRAVAKQIIAAPVLSYYLRARASPPTLLPAASSSALIGHRVLCSYIAEADTKGGCLAIPSRMRVTGPCSMALMLCPPVPVNCARIVINAAKGFSFTLHVATVGGGSESRICSDGTSSSGADHAPISIESSRSCGGC
jgi:hypothetical protein